MRVDRLGLWTTFDEAMLVSTPGTRRSDYAGRCCIQRLLVVRLGLWATSDETMLVSAPGTRRGVDCLSAFLVDRLGLWALMRNDCL